MASQVPTHINAYSAKVIDGLSSNNIGRKVRLTTKFAAQLVAVARPDPKLRTGRANSLSEDCFF